MHMLFAQSACPEAVERDVLWNHTKAGLRQQPQEQSKSRWCHRLAFVWKQT